MSTSTKRLLRPCLVLLALFSALTGLAYPALVTGLAQVAFPARANGSLINAGGRPAGSALIGQPFDDQRYFWGRPSATTPAPYNAAASTGSNLGPTNPARHEAVAARLQAIRAAHPGAPASVPVELVTTSASGLDPHVGPAAALYQVGRVAQARQLPEAHVRDLVLAHVEPRTLGFLGEPRVNVLRLNLALDALRSDR
jgi:K+-transporting ATPase ATPase C chain